MKYEYDVVIIGAGGAGLNIAQLLGSQGLNVCLIDSKKDLLNLSFHTLGSFLDLKKFKLSEKVIASKVTEVMVSSKNIHVKKTGSSYILDKKQLHSELLQKCKENNVHIVTATHITSFTQNEQGEITSVLDRNNNEYVAPIFVDASGIRGILSKPLGLQDKYVDVATGVEYNAKYLDPPNRAHLFFGNLYEGGYGWIFPLQNGRAIVGFGSFTKSVRSELKKRLDRMCEVPYVKKMIQVDDTTVYGGTIPITEVKTKFVYKNVVCVGDSVSQVNPLVGEGYRFVLEAGVIAAPYIVKAVQTNNLDELNGYEKEWNESFYKKYVKAKKLQILADKISKSDIISDLVNVFVGIKTNESFTDFISGDFKKNLLLP